MKILVVGNTGLNNSNNSTNNRMKKIFEFLNDKYGYSFDYYKLRETTLDVDYINYLNLKANPNPFYAYKTIKQTKKNYDLVLAETFNASIVAYFLYFFKKTPFIWRQFGTTFNDELNFKSYFKPKILLKFLLHKIISNSKGCKAIVCTEDGCANRTLYLDKLGIPLSKLFMVKNQRTVNELNYSKINKADDKFRIIQVGRINSWKKIHLLVNALVKIKEKFPKIMNNIELNIIGQTQDMAYEKKLNMTIKENNLLNNIFLIKDLEYHDIEKIFRKTDLSISLTAYNPIIESLQNEIPVITYEYGEIGKVFDNCNAVFILAKDIKKSSFLSDKDEMLIQKELEVKIIELYEARDSLQKLGEEGKLYIENNFPVLDEHVHEITNIYQKVINAL